MTLEWLALLILVPLVVVPLVLLCGFSGCDLVFKAVPERPAPVIVSASATSVSSILIAWTFDAAGSTVYEVTRLKAGETDATLLPRTSEKTLEDTGLDEATTYLYTVVAFEDDSDSPKSNQVAAATFGKVFDALLDGERQRERRTIVQRIEPARLFKGGTRVLITLQRPAAGDLVIDGLYISKAADTAYNPAADLTAVVSSSLLITADPANGPFPLPPVDYALDQAQPLLLAFDIKVPGNMREHSPVPATDATAFVSPIDVFEASQGTRTPGYNSETRIYLVQRIDVV